MSNARATGKVKWFSDVKGYGFIVPDDGGDDVFTHRTAFKPPLTLLKTDDRVSYELVQSKNGKGSGTKAVEVELA
ncbi:cold-shock protein [Bradyrhizobium denitrificans]|uniref:cold-shock protein n=1 Tax=Bradyrhizobium denitrificans TaxID=2734912 RepID=UPI001553105C|nr:cold shock domain-containing protein [Bradyrhizobium sp. LMG 8443]NPU23961.1 cold shock domain-containing protein [Bradyrhizobium sp. LMG 8443]